MKKRERRNGESNENETMKKKKKWIKGGGK